MHWQLKPTETKRKPLPTGIFLDAVKRKLIQCSPGLLLIPAVFVLSACSQSAEAKPTFIIEAVTVTPDAGQVQNPSSSTTPTFNPARLAPDSTCDQEKGVVVSSELDDPRLFRPLPYRIYLPPCFNPNKESGYPTLYLLHGLGRTDSQWNELGVDKVADDLINSQQIAPLIIVMPWERTGIELETAVVDVLIPHLESTYPANQERQQRGIGGISRGGGWALRIGLKHPELFRAIGLHSPAVLAPDLFNLPDWAASIPAGYQPAIWIDIGEKDTLLTAAGELKTLLDELDIKYHWALNEGYHEESYWVAHLAEYLFWYSRVFRSEIPEEGPQ
jgi:enterochelin esterase-like enzyme